MKNAPAAPLIMPILSAGKHRSPQHGACFMEFASYLAGERWSDHPSCTHPLLAELARDVNDRVSDDARASLVPHIHRVVGLTTNDPRVASEIAVRVASAALPIANVATQRALAASLIRLLAQPLSPAVRVLAERALTRAPDAQRWALTFLARFGAVGPNAAKANFARANVAEAHAAVVHTGVAGIASACVDDADSRLSRLLVDTIDAVELTVTGSTAGRTLERVPA